MERGTGGEVLQEPSPYPANHCPMRAIKLSCALLFLLEALLALAFLAGFFWCGGWRAGLLCSASLLVLICLPWLGDLELDYDSRPGRLRLVLGWWGLVTSESSSTPPQLRLLGIRFRPKRRKPSAPSSEPPETPAETPAPFERARDSAGWASENFDSLVRLLLAALQASHELLWGAKELQLKVQSPVQYEWADLALAALIRERKVGPVDLQCTALGPRRIKVHYRAAMLNAALIALAFAADGRPRRLLAEWKKERGDG